MFASSSGRAGPICRKWPLAFGDSAHLPVEAVWGPGGPAWREPQGTFQALCGVSCVLSPVRLFANPRL